MTIRLLLAVLILIGLAAPVNSYVLATADKGANVMPVCCGGDPDGPPGGPTPDAPAPLPLPLPRPTK